MLFKNASMNARENNRYCTLDLQLYMILKLAFHTCDATKKALRIVSCSEPFLPVQAGKGIFVQTDSYSETTDRIRRASGVGKAQQ
jgi:hypothetical protein